MKVKIVKRNVIDFNDASEAERILEVQDEQGRALGFVATKTFSNVSPTREKTKKPTRWGFALVEGEFRSGIQYGYSTRTQALDGLVKIRTLKTKTDAIKVVK